MESEKNHKTFARKEADPKVCLLKLRKLLLHGSLFGFLSGGSQQSADGQGDLLLLLVHSGDLSLDDLALGENVLGLLDAAVSDLRDVDQVRNKFASQN